MKAIFTLLVALCCTTFSFSQENATYDKALAEKLGADEYGMKKFVLVILKSGTNMTKDEKVVNEAFRGHMENINKLAKDGKLIVAGPMGKNEKSYRGIFILDVKTIAEAEALVLTDPAVKAKLLEMELYEWYGGAALPEYLKVQDKITLKQH